MTNKRSSKYKRKTKSEWEKFEDAFCDFLNLFLKECFGFQDFIEEPKRQPKGYWQYGRDISAKWRYENEEFYWWFECKSHKKSESNINKKEVADKILGTLVNSEHPSCWCLVSRNLEPDTWLHDTIPKINKKLSARKIYFFEWTPKELKLDKCIACYPNIWSKIYPGIEIPEEFNEILKPENKARYVFFNFIKDQFAKNNKVSTVQKAEPLLESTQEKQNVVIKRRDFPKKKIEEIKIIMEMLKFSPLKKKYDRST